MPTKAIGDGVPEPTSLGHDISGRTVASSFPFGAFIAEAWCTLSERLFASMVRGIHTQREQERGYTSSFWQYISKSFKDTLCIPIPPKIQLK